MHLRFLYMQELVVSSMVRMRKVLGALDPADILTKYVPKDILNRHLPACGFHEKRERHRERERERERERQRERERETERERE